MAPKIVRFQQVRQPGCRRLVWVALGERTGEDTTLPVLTHGYATPEALRAAIDSGEAFLKEVR